MPLVCIAATVFQNKKCHACVLFMAVTTEWVVGVHFSPYRKMTEGKSLVALRKLGVVPETLGCAQNVN